MHIRDIIEDVAYTEMMLQDRYDTGDTYNLTVTDVNRLISIINRGLYDLYRRFRIKRSFHHARVFQTLTYTEDKYLDTPLDLPNDVLEVVAVLDTKKQEVLFNRADCPNSVVLETPRRIIFPAGLLQEKVDAYWEEEYQEQSAYLPPEAREADRQQFDKKKWATFWLDCVWLHYPVSYINESIDELNDVEIDLPDAYREALIMFIMSRLTSGLMNGAFANYPEGDSYHRRYEQVCEDLVKSGITVGLDHNTQLFHCKGFV